MDKHLVLLRDNTNHVLPKITTKYQILPYTPPYMPVFPYRAKKNTPSVFDKSAFPLCQIGELSLPCPCLTPLSFDFLPLLTDSTMPGMKGQLSPLLICQQINLVQVWQQLNVSFTEDNHYGIVQEDSLNNISSEKEKYFVLVLMEINHDLDKDKLITRKIRWGRC